MARTSSKLAERSWSCAEWLQQAALQFRYPATLLIYDCTPYGTQFPSEGEEEKNEVVKGKLTDRTKRRMSTLVQLSTGRSDLFIGNSPFVRERVALVAHSFCFTLFCRHSRISCDARKIQFEWIQSE